jgi:regulatory protein
MGKITALSVQKRDKDRVNVYIDGDFAFGLAYIAASQLRVGQELSQQEIEALQNRDAIEKAKNSAVRFISYRPRSIAETERNLSRKGYDPAVIEQVIERLCAVDLLNDETFAAYWVEQRDTFKPRSHIALRQELQQKGVDRAVIDKALMASDETEAARHAAAKKSRQLAGLPEAEYKKKLGQFLQRRGFHYGLIREIIDETWRSSEKTPTSSEKIRQENRAEPISTADY